MGTGDAGVTGLVGADNEIHVGRGAVVFSWVVPAVQLSVVTVWGALPPHVDRIARTSTDGPGVVLLIVSIFILLDILKYIYFEIYIFI